MKNKWKVCLLVLAMAVLYLLSIPGAQTVQAVTTHEHIDSNEMGTENYLRYKPWTDEAARQHMGAGHTASNSLPDDDSGYWYLTKNVTLSTEDWRAFQPDSGDNILAICLNGYTITCEGNHGIVTNPQVSPSYTALCDCTGKGSLVLKRKNIEVKSQCNLTIADITVSGYTGEQSVVTVNHKGTFTLEDGAVIKDNTSTGKYGGAVTTLGLGTINRNAGTFIMNGGEIRQNTGYVGGVLNYGMFLMNGGKIRYNYGTNYGGVANHYDQSDGKVEDTIGTYGTMTVGGSAQITNNSIKSTSWINSNVCILYGAEHPLNVADDLQSDTKIALNNWEDGIVKGKVTEETLGGFSLDDPSLGELYVENEELKKKAAHEHCDCGEEHRTIGSHTRESKQIYTPWANSSSLPTEAGYYYLLGDVTISETWQPESGTVLCLNGHAIYGNGSFDVITVNSGDTFTLTDCGENKGTDNDPAVVRHTNIDTQYGRGVKNSGVFNMYGGRIAFNRSTENGNGVYNDASASFNLYMGEISNNGSLTSGTVDGGGVYNKGTFNMYGGKVNGNGKSGYPSSSGVKYGAGVYVDSSAKFTMTGGEIAGNGVTSGGAGSAIYVNDGGTLQFGKNAVVWPNNTIEFAGDSDVISVISRLGDNGSIYIGSLSTDRITQTGKNFYKVEDKKLISPGHIHMLDGTPDENGEDEDVYTKWTSTNSLPTEAGAYCLADDVTVDSGTTLNADVTLCLNGHTIHVKESGDYAYYVTSGKTLNITDCQGGGVIDGGSTEAGSRMGVKLEGTCSLYGGTIKGFGHGVYENSKYSTFTMYDGTITDNHSDGFGGGLVINGTFDLYGGSIIGNSAVTKGGGVYDDSGIVTLYGGSITDNTAGEQGGGIYNTASAGDGVYNVYQKITLHPTRGSRITVTGNTVNGAANNLAADQCIALDRDYNSSTTLLSTGSKIGVTVLNPVNGKNIITTNTKSNSYNGGALSRDLPQFTLDNADSDMELTASSNGSPYLYLTIHHKHTLCNLDSESHDISAAGHSGSCGDEIEYKEWTDGAAYTEYGGWTLPSGGRVSATSCLPRSGNWYLSKDVTLTETWEANDKTKQLNLCFNGHTVTSSGRNTATSLLRVNGATTVNLTDCAETAGGLRGNSALTDQRGLQVSNAYVNLYNGTITGFTASYGAGVAVEPRSGGSFGLYGNAAIQYNKSTNTGDLKLDGSYYPNSELENVSGKSSAGGGGVANYGKFTMNSQRDDAIAYNSAARYGGGLFNWPYGSQYRWAKLLNGGIKDNTAGEQGGGVLSADATGKELVLGGNISITGNTLTDQTANNLYLPVDTKYGRLMKISVDGLNENAQIKVVEIEGREGNDYFNGVTYETLPPELLNRFVTDNGSLFVWNEAHDTILLVRAVPADKMPTIAEETTLTYNGEEQTIITVPEGAEDYYTVSGPQAATDAGEYTITLSLKENLVWPDGTTADKVYTWKIEAKEVKAPEAAAGLIYDGTAKTGVADGDGYTLEGEKAAIDAGDYTVTAKLGNETNYKWDDGTTAEKTITWTIDKKTPELSDFTVKYPDDLTYDGSAKSVSAKLKADYPAQEITLAVSYADADGNAAEPVNVGTYKVTLNVSGSRNFGDGALALDDLVITPMEQTLSFAEKNVTRTYDPDNNTYTQAVSSAKGPVIYSGNKDSVATVDAATGQVTILSVGTVTITAKTDDSNANYTKSSDSYTLVIGKAAQAKPTGLTAAAPSSINGKDGSISGVTSAMEYRIEGSEGSYKTCPDGTLTGLASGEYEVRFKETDCYEAGSVLTVKVPAHTHTFDQEVQKAAYHKSDATCLSPELYYKSCACGVSSEGTAKEATFEVGEKLEHDYQWKDYDSDSHVKQCQNGCGEWDMTTKEAHNYDGLEGEVCLTCGHNRTVNYYDVTFKANNDDYGSVSSKESTISVPEGTTLTVKGNTITAGSMSAKAVPNSNTAQYTYAFEKWSLEDGTYTVKKAMTITASFTCTVNQYTIAWDAQGGSLTGSYTKGTVDYGTRINAPETPVKDTDENNSYAFLGWSTTPDGPVTVPAETVTGDVTYYARFEVQPHKWNEDQWDSDDTYHWHTCTVEGCGYTKDKEAHNFGGEYQHDENGHWQLCKCGAESAHADHTGGTATCTDKKICEICKSEYGDPLGHSFTKYEYNNDATYDEDGTETATCDHDCGETDTRTKAGSKLIDSTAPVITGVENGKTYCKEVSVSITDENTFTVTLNGQLVGLEDGKFTITAMEGEQTLVAVDRFNNSVTVTFTVNSEHTSDEGVVTTEPTAAAEGVKTFTCTVCGEILGTEPVAKTAPAIVEGGNGTHQSGDKTGLTVRSDAAFEDFLKVCVDGKELTADQYILRNGSILVTLTADYLNTLSVGQHTLDVVSVSGTASTVFTIMAKAENPGTNPGETTGTGTGGTPGTGTGSTPGTGTGSASTGTGSAAGGSAPTGDTMNMGVWVIAAIIALCGMGAVIIISRKKRRNR